MKTFYCRFHGLTAWETIEIESDLEQEIVAVTEQFLEKCQASFWPLGRYQIDVRISSEGEEENYTTHTVSVLEGERVVLYGRH